MKKKVMATHHARSTGANRLQLNIAKGKEIKYSALLNHDDFVRYLLDSCYIPSHLNDGYLIVTDNTHSFYHFIHCGLRILTYHAMRKRLQSPIFQVTENLLQLSVIEQGVNSITVNKKLQ